MSDEEEGETRGQNPLYSIMRKIVIALGAFFVLWAYMQSSNRPTPAPMPPAIEETKPLTALEATPEAAETPPQNTVEKERVTVLETQLSEQAKSIEELKMQLAEMQTIKAQMGDITQKNHQKISLLTSFQILKDRVQNGEPYASALETITTLLPTDDASFALLDALKPYASGGIATQRTLQEQFQKQIPELLNPPSVDPSWKQNLNSLIRIRKVGEQQGTDTEAMIARAEAKLQRNDLAGAIKEVETLSALAPWMERAKAHITALETLSALQLAFAASAHD
jgi:hypothetical protein